jgi:hypothetical protein
MMAKGTVKEGTKTRGSEGSIASSMGRTNGI